MAAREKVGEPEFVAFVGIDWADQKHVWCLQPANSRKREGGELEHKPEVVEAWVSELRQRFGHGAIAVAVEQVKGALIARVFGGSPAQAAGLKAGDVITSVVGRAVDSRETFSTYTATLPSSRQVEITYSRDGTPRTLSLKPTDPPSDLGLRILWEVAGLRVSDNRAVAIDEVARGSRGESIGLQTGDYIVGVNGAEIANTKELNQQLTQAAERSSFVLSVQRGRYVYNLTFPMGV